MVTKSVKVHYISLGSNQILCLLVCCTGLVDNIIFTGVCCMLSFQAYSGSSGNCAQLRVIFSFYASTIVPALQAVEKVTDSLMSKLLPYVQKVRNTLLSDTGVNPSTPQTAI